MSEVRLSREANLSLMNLGRKDIGLLEEIEVRLGVVRGDLFQYVVKSNHKLNSMISLMY